MEASHKTHRPHIKVGKDAEEEESGRVKRLSKRFRIQESARKAVKVVWTCHEKRRGI